jgi:hypothetical protein
MNRRVRILITSSSLLSLAVVNSYVIDHRPKSAGRPRAYQQGPEGEHWR